jgi:hypothetical protein
MTARAAMAIIACLALLGSASCGGSKSKNASGEPAARVFPQVPAEWTCKDFEDASATDRKQIIAELAAEAQLSKYRADIESAIAALCAENGSNYQPGRPAADRVATRVNEAAPPPEYDASGSGSGSGGTPAAPPADPQRSDQPEEVPPHAPPTGPTDQGQTEPSPGGGTGHPDPGTP